MLFNDAISCKYYTILSVEDERLDIEYWWKDADWGQRNTLRKHTPQRHFAQHKPHTDYHRIETGYLQSEAHVSRGTSAALHPRHFRR